MNSKKKRKLIAGALVAASATLCITGSLAFFTDRADGTVFAKAGTMDLVFTDISSSKSGANGVLSNNEFAIDNIWENNSLVEEGKIINPGDYFDVSYNLSNAGNKSMDVRQKITITSEEPMTLRSTTMAFDPTYDPSDDKFSGLPVSDGYYLANEDGFHFESGNVTLSDDRKSITYELPDITLSGVGTAAEDANWTNVTCDLQTVLENNYKTTNQWGDQYVWISESTPDKDGIVGKKLIYPDGYYWNLRESYSDENILDLDGVHVVYKANTEYNGAIYEKPGIYLYADSELGTYTLEKISGFDSEMNKICVLKFMPQSGNNYQGKSVTVKLDIQAKQHHNTGEDSWSDWATYETTVEKVN